MNADPQEIAIFAGNSRVTTNAEGSIIVEPQIAAFKAALLRSVELEKKCFAPPRISIGFDHTGIFGKQFLKAGIPHSQQRHPTLSQLKEEISSFFEPIAFDLGIDPKNIRIIREDNAKNHAAFLLDKELCSKSAVNLMKIRLAEEDDDEIISTSCSRVSCAAIAYEYFSKSISQDTKALEIFYENDPWSPANIIINGVLLLEELGHKISTEICLVDKKSEKIIRAKKEPV